MNKANLKFFIALGALILIGICVVATIALYFPQKARAIYSRPLVLIHEPLNREHITLGEHALVNATARNTGGVDRIELWVDGTFYFAQEASPDSTMLTLPLMAPWEPSLTGVHTLIVRAISKDGVDGQASIRVWVDEPEIADQASAEAEAPEDSTETGSDSEISSSSDTGRTALGGPPSGGAPAPAADEPAPAPAGSEPGSADDLAEDVGLDLPETEDPLSEEPTSLKIEALALQTEAGFEALHCYVGMGDIEPRWYPDADHNQSTDETFSLIGDGSWNAAEYLSGDQAPVIMWPGNLAIPFDVSCVGIIAGGTDSIPLGRIDVLAEPDTWDGSPRRLDSRGGESAFSLEYRIGHAEPSGMGFPAILDSSISSPFNVRNENIFELHWDWEPATEPEPEEPMDGFYIYVNNTLQFVVHDEEARSIILPPEWFNPPCSISYEITVSAWRWNADDHSDNFESYPSESYVIERDELEDCDIAAYVTFETLNISNYGVDEIGPALLMFNVSSAGTSYNLNLDGFCRSDGVCDGLMLTPDTAYDVGSLMLIDDMPNYVRVPLTEEGLTLSMILFDQRSDGSDLVCEGVVHVPGEEIYTSEGFDYLGTLTSRIPDERCQVAFSIRSELITSSYDGISFPPLPQLGVEEITIDEETGRYGINIKNYSSGTWAYDLKVLLQRNSGDDISNFTLSDFVLLPGDDTDIFDPEMVAIERPGDLCVKLDPENEVLESVERDNPGWTSLPECLDIPDLTIENAGFDLDSNLIITVQNRGSGPIESNQVRIRVLNALGLERTFVGFLRTDGLYPWESAPIEIAASGLDGLISSYEGRYGLTLIVDPTDEIVESDETNNRFAFGEGPGRMRVIWGGFDYSILEEHLGGYTYTGLSVSYYPFEDEHNYDYFHARVYVEDGVESRLVSQFDIACTIARGIEYGGYTHTCLGRVDEHNPTAEFYLANGEGVRITVSGEVYDDEAELSGSSEDPHNLGSMTFYFSADELSGRSGCRESHPMGIHKDLYLYPEGYSIPWYAGFTLCAVTD
jgi:hypothetical protein